MKNIHYVGYYFLHIKKLIFVINYELCLILNICCKVIFDAPKGNDSLALNLSTMGKGEAWVNGQSVGRYWVLFHTSKNKPSQSL